MEQKTLVLWEKRAFWVRLKDGGIGKRGTSDGSLLFGLNLRHHGLISKVSSRANHKEDV